MKRYMTRDGAIIEQYGQGVPVQMCVACAVNYAQHSIVHTTINAGIVCDVSSGISYTVEKSTNELPYGECCFCELDNDLVDTLCFECSVWLPLEVAKHE